MRQLKRKKDTSSTYSKALFQHITLQPCLIEMEAQYGPQHENMMVAVENLGALTSVCPFDYKIHFFNVL